MYWTPCQYLFGDHYGTKGFSEISYLNRFHVLGLAGSEVAKNRTIDGTIDGTIVTIPPPAP